MLTLGCCACETCFVSEKSGLKSKLILALSETIGLGLFRFTGATGGFYCFEIIKISGTVERRTNI
jgi:hypothetical protein